jgi:hypothetical protein
VRDEWLGAIGSSCTRSNPSRAALGVSRRSFTTSAPSTEISNGLPFCANGSPSLQFIVIPNVGTADTPEASSRAAYRNDGLNDLGQKSLGRVRFQLARGPSEPTSAGSFNPLLDEIRAWGDTSGLLKFSRKMMHRQSGDCSEHRQIYRFAQSHL